MDTELMRAMRNLWNRLDNCRVSLARLIRCVIGYFHYMLGWPICHPSMLQDVPERVRGGYHYEWFNHRWHWQFVQHNTDMLRQVIAIYTYALTHE